MNAVIEKPTTAKSRKAQAAASASAPQPVTAEANAAAVVANTVLSLVNAAATNPDWGYEGGSGYMAAYGSVITDFIKSTLANIADSPCEVRRAVNTFSLCESITLALLTFDQKDEPEAIERQNLLAQAAELLGLARRSVECTPIAFTQLAEGIAAAKAAPPAAPTSLPSAHQLMRLACNIVAHWLRSGIRLVVEEGLAEVAAGHHCDAAELALSEVERLSATLPMELLDFQPDWYRITSVLQLVVESYPKKDSGSWRYLNAAFGNARILDEAQGFLEPTEGQSV